ncbi:hypothetical protein VC83_07042 [Pseudogymnoascus destructans]|uniref:Uncharacterized protein n=1 Tax=Pseudogymnoascus destructans TaxID=655981 RepID=A0A177A6U5_9PEZI|nr:uncharacterized protein VC83_07042 [Pseudogymnoascus destructans]OAF56744.1 hypothetical protein VC83_07042 [Pseudogymnoascus destructans]
MPAVGLAIPFGYDTADITPDDDPDKYNTVTAAEDKPTASVGRRVTKVNNWEQIQRVWPTQPSGKPSEEAALGRLFGKKPKGDGDPLSNGQAKGRANHKHHKSDPSALSNAADKPISPQ